jgi:hypothetical protein
MNILLKTKIISIQFILKKNYLFFPYKYIFMHYSIFIELIIRLNFMEDIVK